MNRILLIVLATPAVLGAQTSDEQDVRAVVVRMFDGRRAADSGAVRAVFAPGARFASVNTRTSPASITYDSVGGWIRAIANRTAAGTNRSSTCT